MLDEELEFIEEPQEPEKPVELYKAVMWKGILETFYCNTCGYCDADEDGMKLHVLSHVPEAERETVLNHLIDKE